MFKYMYYYNGGGVATGDFNNDGFTDIFFTANQTKNRLYLNRGDMRFQDVTDLSGFPNPGYWSTGVSVVDINDDGLLDLYVCAVGNYEILKGRNQLLICTGIDKDGVPHYADSAVSYNLDFQGFSTQAAFLDYDSDGDLDMYLLNHAVHHSGHFAERRRFDNSSDSLSGDRLYRNDSNSFTDVTREAGINSSSIGYGLGIAVADVNLDGYPDIYVGNDFHENDYLYINQGNGIFADESSKRLMHTSQFSMGVDIADINNDAFPEIVSMDMRPEDPYILRRSLGDNEFNIFQMKVGFGYSHQYARNNLQLNRKNGYFSECGLYAGIFATDWSWSPLFFDFDNDGLKDLFVSNGIPKRLNDMDFVNFLSNEEVKERIQTGTMEQSDMQLIEKFPKIKLNNKFFRNTSDVRFLDAAESIEDDVATYSNGAAIADFDNDGDMDIVVNNIDDPALVYENIHADASRSLTVKLVGAAGNKNAVGTKLMLFTKNGVRYHEKFPVRGFQSSMEIPLSLGNTTDADSLIVIWPDNSYQKIESLSDSLLTIRYAENLPKYNYTVLHDSSSYGIKTFTDITSEAGITFVHRENSFNEFDRDPLIPHMISREGPALAVADINHDGLEDAFIGGAKGSRRGLFIQTKEGTFVQLQSLALGTDSSYEDVDACWADVNNDKHVDLIVASGGNEYRDEDPRLAPRVYLNDGRGTLSRRDNAMKRIFVNASVVRAFDFSGDGAPDLFIGGRSVPWEYGEPESSYLLMNDGQGNFSDVTSRYCKQLQRIGLVTAAAVADVDKDGDQDFVITKEWGGITAFINERTKFSSREITKLSGWWNCILPIDVDADGDMDFIAGNLGDNNIFKATSKSPLQMYYGDFDGNGRKEQLLTYFLRGQEIPFANKDEIQKQIPTIKTRYLYAGDFASASLEDVFSERKMNEAVKFSADYFSNAIFINDGKLNFTASALPWEAQLFPVKDAVTYDANGDQFPDVWLAGNFYHNTISMGRYDADLGTLLINIGDGRFRATATRNVIVKGEVRKLRPIIVNGRNAMLLAKNNDSLKLMAPQMMGK
jgi:hypothetical protein